MPVNLDAPPQYSYLPQVSPQYAAMQPYMSAAYPQYTGQVAAPSQPVYTDYTPQVYNEQDSSGYLAPLQEQVYNEQTQSWWLQPDDSSEFADTPIPGFNGLNGMGQIPDLLPGVSQQTKSYVMYGSIAIVALSILFWMSRRK